MIPEHVLKLNLELFQSFLQSFAYRETELGAKQEIFGSEEESYFMTPEGNHGILIFRKTIQNFRFFPKEVV